MATARRFVKRRNGTHPIAFNRCAVDFGPGEWETMGRMRMAFAQQGLLLHGHGSQGARGPDGAERKARARAIVARRLPVAEQLGLWGMPHAVSLAMPLQTVCGLPFTKGMEVPSIWEGDQQVVTFEGLPIRSKCYGCAGAIGGDPEA